MTYKVKNDPVILSCGDRWPYYGPHGLLVAARQSEAQTVAIVKKDHSLAPPFYQLVLVQGHSRNLSHSYMHKSVLAAVRDSCCSS